MAHSHSRQSSEGSLLSLLAEVKVAEESYRAAAQHLKSVREEYQGCLDNQKAVGVVYNAVKAENEAIREYTRALKAYIDVLICEPPRANCDLAFL